MSPRPPSRRLLWFFGIGLVVAIVAIVARPQLPILAGLWHKSPPAEVEAEDSHAGHDHGHAGHDESNSLELSKQARNNLGLKTLTIELKPFEKTIAVPGILIERPGQSTIEVTAPLTGVVTKIAAIQGQAVQPGQLLFELRLTHEELVQAQGDFLKTVEELDVIQREIKRIEKLAESGAIPGKTLVERKYEQDKQEASLRAQEQALQLHGLSAEQVRDIEENRNLLTKLAVTVPMIESADDADASPKLLQVHDLKVEQGQHVTAGDTLCVLVDHATLYIEGSAFEQDVDALNAAVADQVAVSAFTETSAGKGNAIGPLHILYLADQVDPVSRAIHFYVPLVNRLLRKTEAPDGRQFIDWQYKPGQRMQVRIPVETWQDRIVLPVDAIATDGVESYVFQANGDHFDRRPVHIEYRDQSWAVIANDGAVFAGDEIAANGAYQLQTAIKNKSGGAIDPHAGHNH